MFGSVPYQLNIGLAERLAEFRRCNAANKRDYRKEARKDAPLILADLGRER